MAHMKNCINKETIKDIQKAREDYKKGKVLTTKQLFKELDILS